MLLEVFIINEIILALGFTMGFGLMFFISEMIYQKLKVEPELTRKFIHISCGTIAMLVPLASPHIYTIVILGIFFSLLTYFLYRKKLLPSVHAVNRKSIGSVLFPLGIIMCCLFGTLDSYRLYFFIPLGMMIYSDTIAAFSGLSFPIKKFSVMGYTKSVGGSIGFFITSFIISYLLSGYFLPDMTGELLWKLCVILSLTTTIVEMVSVNGWDDLTVPASCFLMIWASNIYS